MNDAHSGSLSQLRRGVLEYCVLALIGERERYGFEIVTTLSSFEGMVTTEGTIYPLLGRLRREGLVETNWQESPNGPPRKYYRLTRSGRSTLRRFSADWTEFRGTVDAMLGLNESGES